MSSLPLSLDDRGLAFVVVVGVEAELWMRLERVDVNARFDADPTLEEESEPFCDEGEDEEDGLEAVGLFCL